MRVWFICSWNILLGKDADLYLGLLSESFMVLTDEIWEDSLLGFLNLIIKVYGNSL